MSAASAPGEELRAMRPEAMWRFARIVLGSWYGPAVRLRVYGRERMPDGPVVVAANHIAGTDPIVLGMASPRSIRYMTKVELYSIPIVRSLLPHTGAFPVRRGASDREAIANGLRVLRAGQVLGIFVEGTRQDTDAIGDAKTGAAMLAIAAGAPILPACITGTDRHSRNPLHPAAVAWGTPMPVAGLSRGARTYRAVAAAIEDELVRLREFTLAAEASGRPRGASPPVARPLAGRVDGSP